MMVIRSQAWPEGLIINSSHRSRWCKEPSSSSNSQSDITSKEHLKILFRNISAIQNDFPILSSWIRSVWVVETETCSACTPEGHRNVGRSHSILQRMEVNPHLLNTFILGHYRTGWIRGAQVHQYRCVAIQSVVRTATLDRLGRVVSSYC
jgi:hypothetical protein